MHSAIKACAEFEQDLILYYYNELSATERQRATTHIVGCEPCRLYVEELGKLLPLTVSSDDPPPVFWQDYSREMRQKLADIEESKSQWKNWMSLLRCWRLPVIATAAVVVLALALTFGNLWRSQETLPDEQILVEVLPIAEDLEFFRTMEVLDAMELLESWGGPINGSA